MKQCEITTDQYVSIVKNLIKLNPNEYRNFDKTAEFILKSGLSNNEKSLSLFSISEIYIGLNDLDNSFYQVGNAVKVADAKILLNTPDDFIASVSTLYKVKKSPALKVEVIEQKIQALSELDTITKSDLVGTAGVLTAIKNYFNTHVFESLDERGEVLKSIAQELRMAIDRPVITNQSFLLERIKSVIESVDKKSDFISLRDIASFAELDNNIVTLKNNQIVEAVGKPEGLYTIDELGNERLIEQSEMLGSKPARNDDYSRNNTGKQEFFEDTITSNFVIKPIANDVFLKEKIENKLKEMGAFPSAGVRVFAVQISGVGDERMKRIQELASNPEYKGLANRTYETFENETQINYLKSTSKGTVITVARPQKANSKFALMGEIIGSGEKFYLYPLDNYVFLNSDNTTQKIDFSNPVHLDKVQELSVKRLNDNTTSELSKNDLLTIKNAYEVYKTFEDNLSKLVENEFSDDINSVDVTEQFFSQYNLGTQSFGKETRQNLSEVIDSTPNLSRKLTIATVDNAGNILKEEERNVVFAFSKFRDRLDETTGKYPDKDKLNKFALINTLGASERIVVRDTNGTLIDTISQQDYLTNYFDPRIKLTDAYIKDVIMQGKYIETTTNIIIRFNLDKTYGYRIVRPVYALSQAEGFATFITTLADVLNAPDKKAQLTDFNKNQYAFKKFASKTGDIELYVNFTSDIAGNLQVEIRPKYPNGRYSMINKETKGDFNFSFRALMGEDGKTILSPANDIRTLAVDLKGGDLVQKVIDENIVFSGLNLTKQKDLAKFYSLVNQLSKEANPSENVTALLDEVKKQQQKFSQLLIDKVINRLLEVGKKYPGFTENFMSDYPDPKHLVVDVNEEGEYIPRIEFAYNNKTQARQDYDKNVSSFDLKTIPVQKLVITSKSPSGTDIKIANVEPLEVTNHPIENIPVSQPPLSEEYNEDITTDLTDDIPEIPLFSISNTEVQTETEKERQNAVQWLQESLPQFNLSQDNIANIIDLATIDGTVLGLFKDKVIYLNDTILSKGVVYHEAFHGVFRYLMTPEQRSRLIDAASSNKKYKSAFTPAALKKFASERNYVYNYEKMFQLQAEEILADGFQNYMNKNTKPQGLVAQLYEILKNLIDMFIKTSNIIDSTYKDVRSGAYSKMQIQSNIYDGQVAYATIEGLKVILKDPTSATGVSQKTMPLITEEQNQLVNMVTKYVIENNSAQTFEEKFQTAQRLLLEKTYNLDELIKKNPNTEQYPNRVEELIKTKSDIIAQYRFMLGARKTGETIYDINNSGDPLYDKRILKNKIQQDDADPLDNDRGQVSVETLKTLVKKKTQELYSLLDGAGDAIDKQVLLKELAGENENKSQLELDFENSEEVSNDVNFDESFGEHNRLDSAPRQLRRFLGIVSYEKEDPSSGIAFPRVIDGSQIWGTLLKITASVPVDDIINQIKSTALVYRDNGYANNAADLEAVYDQLLTYTGMDKTTGIPSKNLELYNMFIDTLHGTETHYMMMYATLRTGIVEEEGNNIQSFTLGDTITKADALKKKRDLIASMITTHAKKRTDKEYLSAVNRLLTLSNSVVNKKIILGSFKESNTQLEELTFGLHNAFKDVGIDLPKSLIKMSILGIDSRVNGNNAFANINENTLKHYAYNEAFIDEESYLSKTFFREIVKIYTPVVKQSISSNTFGKDLQETNEDLKAFFSITKKFPKYILKYDSSELPSVFRNAAGKPVYRYTKYTPLITMAESVRRKGLESTLQKDPYYQDFMKDYFNDNPLFADLLAGKDTPQARKAKLLMDNMNISLFGGIAQFNNQSYKIGKTFGKLDDQSLHVMSILSFLQRTTVSSFETVLDEDGNAKDIETSFQTYLRMFDTLEASQTNFLITSMYQKYADKTGLVKDGKNLKIVADLEGKVKQEFNRIKKEYNKRTENKSNFDSGKSNKIINKYNGVLQKDDKTKADTSDESLRAYNFNYLPYFFTAPENELLTERLLALAKDKDVAFEDIDESTIADLREGLNNFALQELNTYINKLKDLGVVTEKTETVKALKKDPTTGKLITEEGGTPIVFETKQPEIRYLESSLIADTLKIDSNIPVSTTTVYAGTKPNYSIVGELQSRPDLNGLLADHFFNQWYNTLMVNDVFQGDKAMNGLDTIKRNKKFLASGSTMKEGLHTVAYLNTIQGYISKDYPLYGPYYSASDILNDIQITDDTIRDVIYRNFELNQKVFDGQSFSSLFHQADMHNSMGRLTPSILHSLIAKQYRELTQEEIRNMQQNKVVNNSKKTVTASRNVYHKLSETHVDRNDVSKLIVPEGLNVDEVYDLLHSKYMDVYSLRNQIHEYNKINQTGEFNSTIKELKKNIQNIYVDIHSYYEPVPSRIRLHKLLNSMEYHNIDQIMDTEASKNSTKLPVDFFAHENNDYIPLDLSAVDVNNEDKYLQVETSGVKDTARFSVQGKILLPADLNYIEELANKRHEQAGTVMSSTERKAMNEIGDVLLRYQESLYDIADSNLKSLTHFMRKGKDFDMGKVFNLIRENLEQQNAPSSTLKLFDVDASGKPVHSPNLPGIRSMLEYYFFSLYSKHVTDEKGSGFKNIHVSSFGYDVLEDQNGNVVTTEEYKRYTEKYPNVTSRPLGVRIEAEYDSAGELISKKYFVECILPKQFFRSKQHEDFFMENLRKMFALRIPTEDKRSMIVLEVVDYIDSSYLNSIIVPQFIHLLSGSDLDVDSLYGQTFANYVNAAGNFSKYGNYDMYTSPAQGKFIEYIHYMSKDKDFKNLISDKRKQLLESNDLSVSANALEIMYGMGFTQEEYVRALTEGVYDELESYENDLLDDIEQIDFEKEEVKQAFVQSIRDTENDPEDYLAKANRRKLGKEHFDLKTELDETYQDLKKTRDEKRRLKTFANGSLSIEAALQVFEKYGLPVDQANFDSNIVNHLSVLPIHQNRNLEAKIDLLSNEAVFKNLYIHERSSVEFFEEITKGFGRSLDNFGLKADPNTITSLVESKSLGSSYKDMIGIAAVMQKFLALASQYEIELKSENVIWRYLSNDLQSDGTTEVTENNLYKFGAINKNGQRVIALNGNVLGMAADGMKKPIPAALEMNEVNTGITLGMIGIGLDPAFAFGFNFIPEIKQAIYNVQASRFAISESVSTEFLFLNSEIGEIMKKFVTANGNRVLLNELINAGLITADSNAVNIKINRENLMIDFQQRPLDEFRLNNNTLTVEDIGYEVSAYANDVKTELSNEAQKLILLQLYKEQAQQSWKIKNAGTVVDLFKKLNPTFVANDRLYKNIEELRNGDSVFTKESTDKLFTGKQVWVPLTAAIDDLREQSKIFLERTSFFQPIKNVFDTVYTDPSNIARIITSFIAIRKYQLSVPGSRKSNNPSLQASFDQDDKNLIDTFGADYWFTNTLDAELDQMKELYPENKFLQFLKPSDNTSSAQTIDNKSVQERTLEMVSKAKIAGELSENIANDAFVLYNRENLFVKKLFYHELARTGLQYKSGSFLQYLPAEFQIPLSKNIDSFITAIESTAGNKKELIDAIKSFVGNESTTTQEEVYKLFDDLFVLMAHGASKEVGNKKIKRVSNISYNESAEYASKFMKSINFESSDAKERIAIANKIIGSMLGLTINAGKNGYLFDDRLTEGKLEEFVVNMKGAASIPEATEKTMIAVGEKLSIYKDKDDKTKYKFPLMLKVGNTTYLLQGVDNEIDNRSFGKSVINAIAGVGEYKTTGNQAKYVALPMELTTSTLSPIGFSIAQSKRYQNLVTKKVKLDPTFDIGEAMSEGLTADMFEDYSVKQIKTVEISSNAKGLAAALTNPTELAKSKGNLTQSYPVYFQWLNTEGEAEDNTFKDVEQAYQTLKNTAEAKTKPARENSVNYKLMVDLLTAKLDQHPRLVSEINKKGGSAWILSSTHQPTKQNTVWETGGQNWFIQSLNDAYVAVTQPVAKTETLTLENILKEYSIQQLKQGVSLRSLQDKIEQKDFDTIKQAYNFLKAEEKYNTIKSNNEKINKELESLRQQLAGTTETTVGNILTVYNDDTSSEYKIKVLEIERYSDYAIVKGKAAKNKEYTIRIDKNGNTKTGSVDNFVFEAVNAEQKQNIITKINDLKTSLETLKSDPTDYYIDYFETTTLSKLELDIQNINVTFDMVKHFYDQSATGKSFDAYSTEFAAYAANLKTTGMTNPEIIEKLKCL